jgi:hypothetical protein
MTSIHEDGRLTAKFKGNRSKMFGSSGSYYAANMGTTSEEDVIPFELKQTGGLGFGSVYNGKCIWVKILREEFGQERRDSWGVFRRFEDSSASCRNCTNKRVKG